MKEDMIAQKLAKQEVVHCAADGEWNTDSSVKSFWAFEVIWAFSLHQLESLQWDAKWILEQNATQRSADAFSYLH